MSHKNKKNINKEICENLGQKCAFGRSKHEDKKVGKTAEKIYSHSTMKAYMDECQKFGKYCKEEFGCKNLEECRSHIGDYLMETAGEKSSWSVHKSAAALGKLYLMSTVEMQKEFNFKLPERRRADISRSRNTVENDKHFNQEKHKDFVSFCRGCGLRRNELINLKPEQIIEKPDGSVFIKIGKGDGAKGNRPRLLEVLPSARETVLKARNFAQVIGSNRVFEKVPTHADIHSYRADYCTELYREKYVERYGSLDVKPEKEDRYFCRKDKAGVCYSREIMHEVSKNMGHNRIDIIAENYLKL